MAQGNCKKCGKLMELPSWEGSSEFCGSCETKRIEFTQQKISVAEVTKNMGFMEFINESRKPIILCSKNRNCNGSICLCGECTFSTTTNTFNTKSNSKSH